MLKKCAFYVKGFMSLYSLLIILALLLIFYFWHAQIANYATQKLEASKDNGAIFYAQGIWDKMQGITNSEADRNKRALELVGGTQAISDKSGIFSFEIPQDWVVRKNDGPSAAQLASLITESPDFYEHITGGSTFYDSGAQLDLQVVKGEQANAKLADGGYGTAVLQKMQDQFGTQSVNYFIIKDSSVSVGETIVAEVISGGYTYDFRYVFNPKTFEGGEFSFQEILHSFKFANKK
jgi:hypothetical protein